MYVCLNFFSCMNVCMFASMYVYIYPRQVTSSQTRQVTSSLTGIAQNHGQTLVSAIVVNPQAGTAGNAYHLTVSPRYVELGDMRKTMNLDGTFGKGAVGARDAYMHRFYPEIDDNNWNDQCHEIASQTNFADYSMARRLTLIKQQE